MFDKKNILKKFAEFISFESVSTDKNRFSEIIKAVYFIKKELKKLNFQIDIYQENKSPPLIVAKKIISKKFKTLGFYAHYDVQPEDPKENWITHPFKLTLKEGKFFGRGTADDKGHLFQIIISAEEICKKNGLKNNLILIFEGEEEIGSCNFEKLIKKDKEINEIDVFYILDTGLFNKKTPQIVYGLRGIAEFELKVKVSDNDLHSGSYGNLVYNPVQVIANLLSKIKTSKLKIKIPGLYEDVRKIKRDEIRNLKKIGSYKSKIYPSFDVNGILAGYVKEGIKTIIPAEAIVKFSLRLVPDQDYKKIERIVTDFVKNNIPKEVDYKIKTFYGSNPVIVDLNNSYVRNLSFILKSFFGREVIYNRSGGSIPAAEILSRFYKKPIILFGFILPDSKIHAPNENYDEEMFWKGIEVIKKLMEN